MTLGKRKSATGSTSRVDFGAFIDDFRPSCCKKSRFVKKSTLKGDTSFHEIPTTVGARVPVPGPRPGFFFFTLWGFFLYLGFSAFKSTAKRERERERAGEAETEMDCRVVLGRASYLCGVFAHFPSSFLGVSFRPGDTRKWKS